MKTVGLLFNFLVVFEANQGVTLRQQKTQLEEKSVTTKTMDKQILDLVETEQDIDHEIDESSKFCEGIHTALSQIDDKLKQLDITASCNGNGNSAQPFQGGAGAYTKLPKLQLRKFYGKAHKWIEFWDSFKASVDTNQGLNPVLKLEYLKTQCEGAAYQAIAGLELSDSNYEVAIDILKGRFGQRQIILNSHIDTFMKINGLHKTADGCEVRRFLYSVRFEAVSASPSALKIPTQLMNFFAFHYYINFARLLE